MPRNLVLFYNGVALEIVKEFKYLAICFASGGGGRFRKRKTLWRGKLRKHFF